MGLASYRIITLCLLVCFLLVPMSTIPSASVPPGRIIILDGMSNAGKTTLAQPLLKLLGSTYTKVALDDYVTDLWLKKKKGYLPEQEFVDRVHQRVDSMYDDVRSLVLTGKNVLIDTVISGLAGEDDSWHCFEKLKGLSVFIVLVYCPLPIVIKRMQQRNEEALLHNQPGRMRPIVVSAKFGDIYQVAKKGDVVVDVLTKDDIECAYKASSELCEQEKKLYEQLKNDLLQKFDLHNHDSVEITPCLQYDCIVNTNMDTQAGCAQKIYDCYLPIHILFVAQRNECFST